VAEIGVGIIVRRGSHGGTAARREKKRGNGQPTGMRVVREMRREEWKICPVLSLLS